jgi:hypothetical protein
MSFSKNYIGDTVALAVITQTVNTKRALIPGVTVKADLAGLVQANVAEYYFNLAPNVVDAVAGADFNTTTIGSKKAVMPLTAALHVDEKIPNVAIDATAADVLMDRMMKGSIAAANALGAKFIDAVHSLSQTVTPVGADIYARITDAQGKFGQLSSAKVGGAVDTTFSNAVNGVQAKTLIVGDAGRAALFNTPAFQRLIGDSNANTIPGLIGTMLGMDVVYAQDLPAATEFMLLDPEGVAFPYSIQTLRVVESENFNGVRVQLEIGHAPKTGGVWGYAVLPVDSYAIKCLVPVGNGD